MDSRLGGPRVGLDTVVVKRSLPCPCREANPSLCDTSSYNVFGRGFNVPITKKVSRKKKLAEK
jgi:hypothetical protein